MRYWSSLCGILRQRVIVSAPCHERNYRYKQIISTGFINIILVYITIIMYLTCTFHYGNNMLPSRKMLTKNVDISFLRMVELSSTVDCHIV